MAKQLGTGLGGRWEGTSRDHRERWSDEVALTYVEFVFRRGRHHGGSEPRSKVISDGSIDGTGDHAPGFLGAEMFRKEAKR